MKIELDKEDLICLVKGIYPYYSEVENPLLTKYGRYCGGFKDSWEWNERELHNLSDVQLLGLFLICKNSWKD